MRQITTLLCSAGPLLQACGIPLSVVVQPAGGCGSSRRAAPPHTSLLSGLARCRHCYAYINHLCELTDSSFVCSLCGRSTDIKSLTVWHNNYCRYPSARQHLPELHQQVYEVLVDPEPHEAAAATHDQHDQQVRRTLGGALVTSLCQPPFAQGTRHRCCTPIVTSSSSTPAVGRDAAPSAVHMPHRASPAVVLYCLRRHGLSWTPQQAAGQAPVLPVTLALVDAAGPDDFLDLVRGGLTVAMEALPRGSLFGLIGVTDCITLVDMSGQGSGGDRVGGSSGSADSSCGGLQLWC